MTTPIATDEDRKALAFVRDFIDQNGFPPTIRELCFGMGYKSSSTGHLRLKRLLRLGWVTNPVGNRSRTMVVDVQDEPEPCSVLIICIEHSPDDESTVEAVRNLFFTISEFAVMGCEEFEIEPSVFTQVLGND